jgi:hypothetical protein
MDTFAKIVQFVTEHGPDILTALVGILTGIMGIALLVPGEQPEKFLKSVIDFLSKFSRK